MKRTFVTLNGKHYTLTFHPEVTHLPENITQPSYVSIWLSWEVPSVADRYSIRPTMISKSASVSTHGRLGKNILALAPPTTTWGEVGPTPNF